MRKNKLNFLKHKDITMTKDLTTLILRQNHPIIEYVLNKVTEKYSLDLEEVKKREPPVFWLYVPSKSTD